MNAKACNKLGGRWDFNNKICYDVYIRPKRTKEMESALKKYFSYSSHGTPAFETEKERFTKKWGMSPGYMGSMYDDPYKFKIGDRVAVSIVSGSGAPNYNALGRIRGKGKRGDTYVVVLDNGTDAIVVGNEMMKAPRGL
ncbi:unnamed protein product [marine sediment metagenome]|uniref:Uncharacterized protein n=1 Tax=marine sediment metagenome TaxID=412755 RepID=X0ZJ49_9ZZZZ